MQYISKIVTARKSTKLAYYFIFQYSVVEFFSLKVSFKLNFYKAYLSFYYNFFFINNEEREFS